ncbi:4Fe-4S dicluster domain-containing protein [candidate division WOR-3 bacterium]|nr:4Fe-4S dicluster domain-containing protein [candidate division WOR-3 bacterium]
MKYWRKPLDADRRKAPRGAVHVIEERCKGCGFCITYCPRQVLEASTDFNRKGYHPPIVMRPERCVNCRLCEALCPEFAIWNTLEEETAREQSGG